MSSTTTQATMETAEYNTDADVICIGLDLSTLAVAVALADENPGLRFKILERHSSFAAHLPNVFGGERVSNTFMRDLVTTSNPRSYFTFINYLHQKNRLAAFVNVSSMRPLRLEMNDYLRWVATEVEKLGWITYDHEVFHIEAETDPLTSKATGFVVRSRDTKTGKVETARSKRITVASNKVPRISRPLSDPTLRSFVCHVADIDKETRRTLSSASTVAVVGASSEAARLFRHLQVTRKSRQTTWFVESAVVRPSDGTAFSRSLVDTPSSRAASYPPELRKRVHRETTNKSHIPLDLVDHLYESHYDDLSRQIPTELRSSRIVTSAEIVETEIVRTQPRDRVRLLIKNPDTGEVVKSSQAFDLVVAATGYQQTDRAPLLSSLSRFTETGELKVGSYYQVDFARAKVSKDCGVWLLGSLGTEEDADELFPHLAEQGERISASLMALMKTSVKEDAESFTSMF
ncbi:Protein arginine N-methyltransferase 1 [Sphaceloma murrayae]|uniref:L-ornithine N(5)-monooxygenase [NAD(P)H] n=1 Tax=Sphaceloma murrayae TaxID=2082308 RepID=A0A2K1QGC9_9PEZI|nr:Protein arginine N-methyltransferase 1 [Sphaceloma murrayae]